MAGNSESYTKRLESMRANLAVDERRLGEMIRTGAKADVFGRDRETLEREIETQVRRIKVAATY
jgi:hypothetical protein